VCSPEVVHRYREYTYIQGEMRRIVEKERIGKERDRCPPYITPPSKHSVTMHEDCQEVARSTLVKGIESKMATLI
jgi:hypothetical protein